ncbi:MAG: hypothetical protein JXA95_10165 [Spirochaetales bacterium]|nr:hypothetical protein [Spirochaetales bacterium]
MESYYSYSNFLSLLMTAFALFPLTISMTDLFTEEKRGRYGTACLLLILFLMARVLMPVCPDGNIRSLLGGFSLLTLPVITVLLIPAGENVFDPGPWLILFTAVFIMLFRIKMPAPLGIPAMTGGSLLLLVLFQRVRRDSSNWKAHQNWIVKTLRESVMLFDSQRRIISGGQDIFPPPLIRPGRNLTELFLLTDRDKGDLDELKELYNRGDEGRGMIRLEERHYSFRFIRLEREKGFLLTLLDTSEEQALVSRLSEQNRILHNRQTILQGGRENNLTIKREENEIRTRISGSIQKMVEKQLTRLRAELKTGDISAENLNRLLAHATKSMTAIRKSVSELRGDHSEG